MSFVWNFENWANNLTLHLPIYKNNILLIIDNIANLLGDMPYLSPQIINNILENFCFNTVNFAQANDDRNLESKSNSEIIKDVFLNFLVDSTCLRIYYD